MIARLPIIPTIFVVAAALTMAALGVWQLGRAQEKAALLARYETASEASGAAEFPVTGDGEAVWFRRSAINCVEAGKVEPVAGTAANGAKGWAMRTQCTLPGGGKALVDLGFSRDLAAPGFTGGPITGIIAPGPRLVADPGVAGLRTLARPDPASLPNNHLAYAGQWFFFALTALIVFGFAVRARLRKTR